MYSFVRKAILLLAVLVLATGIAGYICIKYGYTRQTLLPAQSSALPWHLVANTDEGDGGSSSIVINDSTYTLDFSFFTTEGVDYPYISVATEFIDSDHRPRLSDISNYSTVSFSVKCDPKNVLAFVAITFDEAISVANEISTYRMPTSYFTCENDWKNVEIDITKMEIPEWWFKRNKIELSDQQYNLNNVYSLQFTNSDQSPHDTPSNVKISRLALQGRDWQLILIISAITVLAWSIALIWFFKHLTRELVVNITDKIQQDKALGAYKHLTIEPKKEKERSLLLQFIATEYANPDLTLELASTKLGINRNKINHILREELGLTFNTYLNKLRLVEAARLLNQVDYVNVAEVASLVGYNNSSYFTKLFKKAYGKSPTSFKASGQNLSHP